MDRSKFDEMMKKSVGPMGTQKELSELIEKHIDPEPKLQIGFDVVEVQRLNLQPGDVLSVTVKNDDLSQESVDALRYQLQQVFPDNKVFVFAMGTSDDVQLSIVSQSNPVASCGPVGYCSDCNCGKKDQALASEKPDGA